MQILTAGATGATGRLLTRFLLENGHQVKAIVRSPDKLPEAIKYHENLTVVEAAVLDLTDEEMARQVDGCGAVALSLGHNMTLKGIYGQPRRLVTGATRRLVQAVKANDPAAKTKFVLMNTAGNRNRDLDEPISLAEKAFTGLLHVLLPPHADNVLAADFLRRGTGQNDPHIEWVVVRPDTLLDETAVSDYTFHPSPVRSALFDPGETSRINVAHFMADLIDDDACWRRWRGQMPVIYNK